jgi:hypothetical protein
MNATEQTLQQIERALKKIADKYPDGQEASQLTDIHVCVNQETGELLAFDDDDKELNRCVVEQWIENKDDDFYEQITTILRKVLRDNSELVDSMSIMKPYAFVLEDDEREVVSELYVVDGDTIIIDPILMKDLDKDLDTFFEELMKK